MQRNNKNTGFTLIELSIVLVIIGLIVGGIVGGKALIKSARLQAVVSDMNKYYTALMDFKLQYDALPGDLRDAYDYWGAACGTDATGWGGCNGNGDNEIEYWHEETLKMWQHMSLAGVVEGSYNGQRRPDLAGSPNHSINIGVNAPKSDFSSNSSFIIFSTTSQQVAYQGGRSQGQYIYNGLVMLFDAVNPTDGLVSGSGTSNSALLPAEAKKIDGKMDDGLPYSGKIIQHASVKSGCFGNWVNNWLLDRTTTECEIRWLLE